jgi:hypothetical protein
VSAKDDIAAPKGKRAPAEYAPIDERTRRGVMHGGRVILACAAGISFPNLYALGRIAGLPVYLAPLLPLSIDAYAYVAMWFADQVPARHPARASALRNGAVALAMSVACNVLDRFLVLAGAMVQPLLRDVLLSAVFALPPFIVGRVLHLRALADGGADAAAPAASAAPERRPAAPPAPQDADPPPPPSADPDAAEPAINAAPRRRAIAAAEPAMATVTDIGARGAGMNLEQWTKVAAPVYRELADRDGSAPTAGVLAAELARRGHPAVKDNRARAIRRAVEEHLGSGAEAADGDPEPVGWAV